ncbi:hypothetical protein CULT_1040011 [[Clostridium] ultunense Esp]|nr:hypothetical protein CULT_1040011 [[Clostridium] ultunense Esp]
MKIATSTWSFHPELLSGRLTFAQLIAFCREHGIEGIEIVDIDLIDVSLDKLIEIKRLADKNGIQISCLSLEHDLCRLSEEARRDDVRKVERWISYAKALNVDLVRVFTGWTKQGASPEEQDSWVIEGMRSLARKAEEAGVWLVLENHNDIRHAADDILDLIRQVGSPRLCTCPDPYNYAWSDKENQPIVSDRVYEETEKLLPLAKNTHMKITKFKEDGEEYYMDCGRILKLLRKYGYDGFWTIEFAWPRREGDFDFLEEVAKGAKLLRKYLNLVQ